MGTIKGIEIGVEKGIGICVEKTAVNLLGLLNKEQISEITGLDRKNPDELEKGLKTEPTPLVQNR